MVVLPLYSQYSCSTVAAVWDELARILARKRGIPGVSFIRDYADDSSYIDALAKSARDSFAQHGEPDLLLLSYHGIPQRYADEGDEHHRRADAANHPDVHSVLPFVLDGSAENLQVRDQRVHFGVAFHGIASAGDILVGVRDA